MWLVEYLWNYPDKDGFADHYTVLAVDREPSDLWITDSPTGYEAWGPREDGSYILDDEPTKIVQTIKWWRVLGRVHPEVVRLDKEVQR